MSETETETHGEAPMEPGDTEHLGRLLLSLWSQQATGILVLERDGVVRRLHLFQGVCCSFASSQKSDAVGPVLERAGWLTPERLGALRARSGRTTLSAIALEVSDLPAGQDMRGALRLQLQEVGASCFAWDSFRWRFDTEGAGMPTSIGLNIDPIGLVADGFLRFATPETVQHILGGFGVVPVHPSEGVARVRDALVDVFGADLLDALAAAPRPVGQAVSAAADPKRAARTLAALAALDALETTEVSAPLVFEAGGFGAVAVPTPAPATSSSAMNAAAPLGPASSASSIPVIHAPVADPDAEWNKDVMAGMVVANYFDLVGVPVDATPETIKETITRLKAKYDLARVPTTRPDLRDLVAKVTSRLAQAQATLLHPDVRRQYINTLAQQAPTRRSESPEQRANRLKAEPFLAQARSFEQVQDWDKAREAMAKAIDAAPKEGDYQAMMGWFVYKSPNIPGPERERLMKHHLGYAVELNPEDHLAHHYWGVIYSNQGNIPRAKMELQTALKNNPAHAPSRELLDRITRKTPISQERDALPKYGKRPMKKAQVGAIIALAVLLATGGIVLKMVTFDDSENFAYRPAQLDTKLKLVGVAKSEAILSVDAGPGWTALSPQQKAAEAERIATAGKRLGHTELRIYGGDDQVVYAVDGKVQWVK